MTENIINLCLKKCRKILNDENPINSYKKAADLLLDLLNKNQYS